MTSKSVEKRLAIQRSGLTVKQLIDKLSACGQANDVVLADTGERCGRCTWAPFDGYLPIDVIRVELANGSTGVEIIFQDFVTGD